MIEAQASVTADPPTVSEREAPVPLPWAMRFVSPEADGFYLPEAKGSLSWIDADHAYVRTDFGPGTLTDSGYPRIVKRWSRGTPLATATEIFLTAPGSVTWVVTVLVIS